MKWCLVLHPSASSSTSSSHTWDSKRGIILAASISALGAAATFAIFQLSKILFSVVRDSEYEAGKLITALTATINSDSPDVEIPEELELFDDLEEIYTYGSLQELYYRRNVGGDSDWQWSFDGEEWYSTADLSPDNSLVLDPPSIIFVARLHLQSVARRKFAATAAHQGSSSSSTVRRGAQQASRIPPPVELPDWAQQQMEHHAAAATGKPAAAARHKQPNSRHGTFSSTSSSGSSEAATDTSLRGVIGEGSSGSSGSSSGGAGGEPGSCTGAGDRQLADAPDMLCCPITGQIMLQPVTLPSGKTFEYEAVRRWVTQHGTDPTTLAPVSILDLHPNLLIREMVEKWLAGRDPLAVGHED